MTDTMHTELAKRIAAWRDIADGDGAPVITMSRQVLGDLVSAAEHLSGALELVVAACETDLARLTAELADERARCDEIAGFVREHRARIHRPTCMDGQGCRCGLADLPMWGERDERRGVRA